MLLQLILRMSFTVRMMIKLIMSSYVNLMNVLIKADPQSCYGYVDKIYVEFIDNCVKKLKVGKACGPDNIGAEHIL